MRARSGSTSTTVTRRRWQPTSRRVSTGRSSSTRATGVRTPVARVDDERPVETLRDVGCQRRRVTVVEVEPERARLELVRELLADVDQPAADLLADPRSSVHDVGVDPVEVDRVRVRAGVDEVDPQVVSLACPQRGARNAPVVRPGCVPDAGNDLDLLVVGDELPFAQGATAGEPARLAPVEVAQHRAGIEA